MLGYSKKEGKPAKERKAKTDKHIHSKETQRRLRLMLLVSSLLVRDSLFLIFFARKLSASRIYTSWT